MGRAAVSANTTWITGLRTSLAQLNWVRVVKQCLIDVNLVLLCVPYFE